MQPLNPYASPSMHAVLSHPATVEVNMVIAGQPHMLRDQLHHILAGAYWNVAWDQGGWSGLATKGHKLANVAFGPFAMYHELRFTLQVLPDGTTGLTLYRQGSGCFGGIIGGYLVKKAFRETSERVHAELAGRGLVLASRGR